jgi:hypothetical protein
MSITLNGIIVQLKPKFVPEGFVHGDVDKLATTNLQSVNKVFAIPKTTVAFADDFATFTALTLELELQVLAYLEEYFDATKTINSFATFGILETNDDGPEKSGYYTTDAVSYLCHVRIYIETA